MASLWSGFCRGANISLVESVIGSMAGVLVFSSVSLAQELDPDLGDHAGFSHAMRVETTLVDGLPTVFQYGEVRPDFEALTGNEYRERLDLDGEWEFRFESEDKARLIQVPHNWEAMSGSKFWDQNDDSSSNPARYNGAGWYRRSFSCAKTDGRRYRLEFHGVRERARVWVNGQEVALHEGLGAPFSLDVTEQLVSGENEVKLKVLRLPHYQRTEEGRWEEMSSVHTPYPKAPDYWPYAGVTGSVALWDEAEVTMRKIQVRPLGETLQVRAWVSNQGEKPFVGGLGVASSVFAEGEFADAVTIAAGGTSAVQLVVPLGEDAIAWSPESPELYQLQVRLASQGEVVDGCEVRFGLREFGVLGEQLALNKQPVFLKGVAAYSETENGAALTREENRAILQRALDAGANFVRLPVRQRSPMVYQLADEMGLMLTGEWGGFWYKEQAMGAQTEDLQSVYQSMGRVAVWDLMNRPSVVLWCTSNECHQFCPEYEPFVKMGNELVHELDEGLLPVTWAAWHPHKGQPHFEWADVIGFNEYRGAMDPFEELRPDVAQVSRENPGKPIVIMENGSWSRLGRRGPKGRKGTEDWQADLLRRQWDVLKDFSSPLSGYTFWILQDYRSRKNYTGNRRSNGWSRMGMYTPQGEVKMVRDVFRDLDFSYQQKVEEGD